MSQTAWEIDLTEWFVEGSFIIFIMLALFYIPFYDWRETLTGKAVTILILSVAGALLHSVFVIWGLTSVKATGFWNEFFIWVSVVSLAFVGLSGAMLIFKCGDKAYTKTVKHLSKLSFRRFPDMGESVLPCFKCGKQIEIEPFTQGIRNAMPFITHGGYGSTVYDPGGGYSLRIHICDDCVRQAGEQGIILEATTLRQPDKVTYEKWNPGREY